MQLGSDGRLHSRWDPRSSASQEEQSGELAELLSVAAEDLTLPSLLIRAGESEVVTPEQLDRFAKLVPHAVLAVIDGARHTVTADTNPAYASVILGFLEEHGDQSPLPPCMHVPGDIQASSNPS
jgi:non-heme chloroperoxidase